MPSGPRQSGDDISVFLAVCAAGSFAAAAPRLGLSASAVAKAVARLEARLQVRLFHRTTRSLALTAEAAVYREACEAARGRIDRVEAELAALASEPAGLVRISLPPLFGTQIVAPALFALRETWPGLRFDISTSTALADLPGERTDLAVRIGELPDLPGVTARRLGVQRVVLCGAAEYIAKRGKPVHIGDLSQHALIAAGRNGRAVPWQLRSGDGDRLAFEPQAGLLLDGSLLTLAAIRAGQGLGLVPCWLVREEIARGELVSVLETHVAGHLPVHALWITAPVMLPRLRASIDAIVNAARGAIAEGLLV
ncbi:LysR family transcriptional regulator [Novosphingobium sp. RL4]|uniref:LysR family transcriptional regulator n=1 Tax=Novosphingobium sp. RL4 TaxID=3109595 RepID=UPI002D79B3D1|nr:LysR family transcriptional regulator [Novosphingobium sp. RL4]WRT95374.1 LysR family transcriptional regulator [Novosphingobium sp. RL4]